MVDRTEVGAPRTSEAMSDEVLIHRFIEEFFQGQMALLANHHLRTEPSFNSMQLLSTLEGVVATAKLKSTPMEMIVRHGTASGELMHRALLEQSFYPMLKAPAEGCYIYRFCTPPEGYYVQQGTAKDLWRACWGRGIGQRSGIPMDLLVWRKGPPGSKETWYSLKGMDCDLGQLTVKMLGWSEVVQGTDLIVWARQISSTKPSGPSGLTQASSPSQSSDNSQRRHPPFRH
jgi:hypothetical protein